MTALKAMTIWPAYQHFEEGRKGSIEVGKLADFVILSADPTKVAPTSLAQLKVTATIKEGATIFALDAQQQRKAGLMLNPGPAGDAFGRTIRALAVYREYERLPVFMQTPVVMRHLAAMPHSNACTGAAINELVAAMLAGSGERSDEPAQAPRTSVH
jgi:hypothetical protein